MDKIHFLATQTGQIILSLIIVLITYGIARLIVFLLHQITSRLAIRTRTHLDEAILQAIVRPLYIIILVAGIYLAGGQLGRTLRFHPLYFRFMDAVLFGLAVLTGAYLIANILQALLKWYTEKITLRTETRLDAEFTPLIKRILKIFIYLSAAIIILDHFGVKIWSIVAAFGLSSLAIAFAAQDTLSNMISGFVIMVDRPFLLGDQIKLASGELGQVIEIGLRTTRILTDEHSVVVVPNAELGRSRVINYSYPDRRKRLTIDKELSAENDISHIKKIIQEVALSTPGILSDPSPTVQLTGFTSQSLKFSIRVWLNDSIQEGEIQDRFNIKLRTKFQEENIR